MSEYEAAMKRWNRLQPQTRELLLSAFNLNASSSVGAVSDAAPHPTVGDAPDRTVTPSVGSGALSSLEDRVSALEADARLVPTLISATIRSNYLQGLMQMGATSREE